MPFKFDLQNQQDQQISLEDPNGYCRFVEPETQEHRTILNQKQILEKKLWTVSTSGGSQIFMMMVMMYMIGNDISIFTIIFLL